MPIPASSLECIIYCRVSDKKQLTEGDGLRSQEKRCRDYATAQGYAVLRLFLEKGFSGAYERPAMTEMLGFLKAYPGKLVVIVDDLKRFARDVRMHWDLKDALVKSGSSLESPSFHFDDSPEGRFIETLMAAQAELERNQNQRQVVNRQRARLEQGFWTFGTPPSYGYIKHPVYHKIIAADGVRSKIIAEAFDGFASGRFASQMDLVRFFEKQGYYGTKTTSYTTKLTQVGKMLRNVLYAGHVEYPKWKITLRKGQHVGIISLETYEKIQKKLALRPVAETRADIREEFPLRGYVLCMVCGDRLTASWSRGRSQYYPYYHCKERSCSQYGKCIPKAVIEERFELLLSGLDVPERVLRAAKQQVERLWARKLSESKAECQRAHDDAHKLDADLRNLADRLASTKSEIVARTLEDRIEKVSKEHAILLERAHATDIALPDVGTAFERVRDILKSPLHIWKQRNVHARRLIARIAFADKLRYHQKTGFGTAEKSLPYRVSSLIAQDKSMLVHEDQNSWNQFAEAILEWDAAFSALGDDFSTAYSSGIE